MIKRVLISISVIVSCTMQARRHFTSQTFLFPRPLYHQLAALQGPWLAVTNSSLHGATFCSGIQIVPLYQQSTSQTAKDLASYFLLDCKQELLFAGDESPHAGMRDVRAEWFNLPSTFSGILTLCPRQRQYGFVLEYKQAVYPLLPYDFLRYFYISARVPVVAVRNSLGLEQRDLKNIPIKNTFPRTLCEVVQQPSLAFARFYPGTRSDIGIAELRFDLGTTFIDKKYFLLTSYSALIIPTFRKIRPTYIFDSLVGINGHIGISSGVNLQIPLTESCDLYQVAFFFNIENIYYLDATHQRTFDVRTPHCTRKEWSRYLQVRKRGELRTQFAANVLTIPVKVKPYNTVMLDGGFRLFTGTFLGELGYHLWARGDEDIEFKRPCCAGQLFDFERYGIAGISPNNQEPVTASDSTIQTLAPADDVFVPLRLEDLDPASGVTRGTSTHMIYASFAYTGDNPDYTSLIGIGVFYEHAFNNAALTQWGIWAKLGLVF